MEGAARAADSFSAIHSTRAKRRRKQTTHATTQQQTTTHTDRKQPDDYAPDGVPPDVLEALRRAARDAGADADRPPPLAAVEAEGTYYSPTDDLVMERVR